MIFCDFFLSYLCYNSQNHIQQLIVIFIIFTFNASFIMQFYSRKIHGNEIKFRDYMYVFFFVKIPKRRSSKYCIFMFYIKYNVLQQYCFVFVTPVFLAIILFMPIYSLYSRCIECSEPQINVKVYIAEAVAFTICGTQHVTNATHSKNMSHPNDLSSLVVVLQVNDDPRLIRLINTLCLLLPTYHDRNISKRIARPKAFWLSGNAHTSKFFHPNRDQIRSMVHTLNTVLLTK
ncbi:hypothetical protein AGLY_015947, partial [Aphis glycines]